MKQITLRFKFLLIILLLCIPTSVATLLMSNQASYSIRFANMELSGSEYLQPIAELQKLIGEHRVATASSLVDKNTLIKGVRRQINEQRRYIDELN